MELKPLLEALEDDLQKKFFYHYPRQKAITLLRIRIDWAASLGAHPSEVDAGVDCYAIGHYAACVFHLMRVAEIGMGALARERQVSFPKHPLEWAEWQNIIDQIDAGAEAATAGMSRGAERRAIVLFLTVQKQAAVANLIEL
jgi:hypothetical protein